VLKLTVIVHNSVPGAVPREGSG